MKKKLYSSGRTFRFFTYDSTHSRLVLRSPRNVDSNGPTRVSILFVDVRAVELRTFFNGIEIEEVSMGSLKHEACRPDLAAEPGHKAYLMRGSDWQGFVICDHVVMAEDEKGFFEPVDCVWPPDQDQNAPDR